MPLVLVTATYDHVVGTGAVVRRYEPSPEPQLAPDDHVEAIVAAGRGERVSERGTTIDKLKPKAAADEGSSS